MAKISIDRFNRVGFSLVRSKFKWRTVVQGAIHWKGVAVILLCTQGSIQASLHGFFGSIFDNIPTQDTTTVSIYDS